jgi:hypothetical protein
MTFPQMAASFSRLRRLCAVAVPVLAVAMAAGCSHNRTSYRPLFARPAQVVAPCTNCGGSTSAVVTEGAVSAPAVPVPAVPVPAVPGPTINSNVPVPSSSIQGSSVNTRNATSEPPPSAKIGAEPEYDELSPSSLQRSNPKSSSGTGGAKSGQGPPLQAPNSGASSSTGKLDNPSVQRTNAAASPTNRRTALGERLQPFVAGSSASELFYPNKADRPWRYIVLHHSASAGGNYDQIDQEHRKILGYDGCGYHFVIGNGTGSGDGQIEVAQRWNNQKQGVHCRNARSHDVDEYGIGICLIGDLDKQPPTPRQVAASHALVDYLSQHYRIEPAHISTHSHLAATPTVCPGKFFPAQSILATALGTGQPGSLLTTRGPDRPSSPATAY